MTGTDHKRHHMCCSNYNKPNKADGCKAKYVSSTLPSLISNHRYHYNSKGGVQIGDKVFNGIPHNHPPPSRVRLDQDIKEKITEMATYGVKRSAIHRVCIHGVKYLC